MNQSINNKLWPTISTWFCLLLIMGAAGIVRYHLVDLPLERDEGEYAYGGQLLLQGIPPYLHLYNMKLPGIYLAYASILAIFGQTHTGVHLGLLLVNSLSILTLFLLSKRLLGPVAALGSTLFFALVSMGQPVQGVFANSEHFVLLPALIGAYLLSGGKKEKTSVIFVSGLFFGLAFIVKQHGVFFVIFGLLFLAIDALTDRSAGWKEACKRSFIFTGGALLPYGVVCLWLFGAGVFDRFWFWTITYARTYTGHVAWANALVNFKIRGTQIVSVAPWLWLFVPLGGLFLCCRSHLRRHVLFLGLFVLCSFLAICPGLYFRPHYFILLLPAVSLLAGATIAGFADLWQKKYSTWAAGLVLVTFILAASAGFYKQRGYLVTADLDHIVRSTYWPNPFNESLPIADFIAKRTEPNDTIAIIGSEPQIYFYANRRSASGYIYMYPLMERHSFAATMHQNLAKEVEEAKPKFLIFVRIDLSWLQKRDSPTLIYEWFTEYKKNYHRVGMAEIFERTSLYSWSPRVKWPPTSPYWIEILERNSDQGGAEDE